MEYEILTRSLKDSAANSKLKLLKEGEIFGIEKPGGEKRIHLGPISEEEKWDRFFFPKKDQTVNVTVQKIDLIKYMIEAKDEFFNPRQSYRLNISEYYDSLFQQTLNIPDESFQICFEKNTDSKRYYLTRPPKSPLFKNYNFIIDICLPIVTKFVFLRIKKEDSYIYYLRPEFKPDYTTPDIINNDSIFENRLQQIFYGAPGTGKSHKIKDNEKVKEADKKQLVFRTTFHPDSDYSTFVGAYKPTMKPVADKYKAVAGKDEEITYSFVPQAFLQAYIAAWNNPEESVFLIIEEINRGNCAQIFGDLFQLLDRDNEGFSEYPIMADNDLKKYLNGKDEYGQDALTNKDGIKENKLNLPKNLYIWATMNTSDQSLFPIDSAFKRRWEWKYMPIGYENTNWEIVIGEKKYKWVDFQRKINDKIYSVDNSEDKQLGDYFVNADRTNNIISSDTLLNKILFYLWNDVCKDDPDQIFRWKDDKEKNQEKSIKFSEFFCEKNERDRRLQGFMAFLGVNANGDGEGIEEKNDDTTVGNDDVVNS